MNDTPPAVAAKFREMMMAKSPAERLAMASRMFSTAKALVQAGLLQEHGPLTRAELRRLTFLRFYGNDFSEPEKEKILNHLANT